jgi:hypothetical protein
LSIHDINESHTAPQNAPTNPERTTDRIDANEGHITGEMPKAAMEEPTIHPISA